MYKVKINQKGKVNLTKEEFEYIVSDAYNKGAMKMYSNSLPAERAS